MESDKLRNFGGNSYKSLTNNIENKLKSNNILVNSFINTKYENVFVNFIDKIVDFD